MSYLRHVLCKLQLTCPRINGHYVTESQDLIDSLNLYFNNVHKRFTHVSRNWLINVTLHIKQKIMSWEKKRLPKTLKVYKYISLIRILEWQLGKLILGSKWLTHPTVFQLQKKHTVCDWKSLSSWLQYNLRSHYLYDWQLTLLIKSRDDLREHTLTAHLVCLCQSPCWNASFLVFEL